MIGHLHVVVLRGHLDLLSKTDLPASQWQRSSGNGLVGHLFPQQKQALQMNQQSQAQPERRV